MATQLTLILGGARSGKSSYAEALAAELAAELAAGAGAAHGAAQGSVLYVATAEAFDDEMRVRIANHRAQRPAHWRTLEAPRHPGAALAQLLQAGQGERPAVVLLDCLTLLANNVLIALPEGAGEVEAAAALGAEVDELLAAMRMDDAPAHWIIVSNEVGLGIVPATPLGRLYRDVLGRANGRLAAAADRVVLMVAGIALAVKG